MNQKNQSALYFDEKSATNNKIMPISAGIIPIAVVVKAKLMFSDNASGDPVLPSFEISSNAPIIPTTVPSKPKTGPSWSHAPQSASFLPFFILSVNGEVYHGEERSDSELIPPSGSAFRRIRSAPRYSRTETADIGRMKIRSVRYDAELPFSIGSERMTLEN